MVVLIEGALINACGLLEYPASECVILSGDALALYLAIHHVQTVRSVPWHWRLNRGYRRLGVSMRYPFALRNLDQLRHQHLVLSVDRCVLLYQLARLTVVSEYVVPHLALSYLLAETVLLLGETGLLLLFNALEPVLVHLIAPTLHCPTSAGIAPRPGSIRCNGARSFIINSIPSPPAWLLLLVTLYY